MRKGDQVVYRLGAGSYEGIRGRVLQLLPGGRARVELSDGYKLIEPRSAFEACVRVSRKDRPAARAAR